MLRFHTDFNQPGIRLFIMNRLLTKSRFKIGLDCPSKLFYTGKSEYPNLGEDNSFLEALAEGGYQVGELAKCYYPNGIDIEERGSEIPLRKTKDLLSQDQVVIFEAAFKYNNLFIRTDIIEKVGNTINLFEVKSKSFDGTNSLDMLAKKGGLASSWREYLYDVAFQKYVISRAYPDWDVRAYLMLADKNATATVNGLNQKFQLKKVENDRTYVQLIGGTTKEDLGEEILIRVNVDDLIQMVYEEDFQVPGRQINFVDYVHYLADKYEKDEKIITPINKDCKACEFRTSEQEEKEGKLSGFKECWSRQLKCTKEKLDAPLVLDVWNFRGKQKLMDNGTFFMKDILEEDLGKKDKPASKGMTPKERQWLQITKTNENDLEPYIDIDGLRRELRQFVYPLHFIDFETSMLAIPFHKGRKPYEQVAFQFSHHTVSTDHVIEHKGQYLSVEKGEFPNFHFLRALKKELENDEGTIFRYANHENAVLNQIMKQLIDSSEEDVPDKEELIAFSRTITHSDNHQGERDMVDLLQLVKDYYYHPFMGGSNSIKYVLPAVLNSSDFIQKKYSQPIYGQNSQIKSLNFEDGWTWINQDEHGKMISPYKLLPDLFADMDEDVIDEFFMNAQLADGGAAMTAYAKMQFAQITELERKKIASGLLRYCELDTLAMVMIWEYWNNEINTQN